MLLQKGLAANLSNGTLFASNSTLQQHRHAEFIPWQVIIALLLVIFFLGLFGNSIVVFVLCKKRRLQSFTNWLILNLAIADLAVSLICIPLGIPLKMERGKWIYGTFLCTIFYPIGTATIICSAITLTVLSCFRCWAMRYPFGAKPSIRNAKMIICVAWIGSFILTLPSMTAMKYVSDYHLCYEAWSPTKSKIYTIAILAFSYALPFIIITFAYATIVYEIAFKKKKRKRTPSLFKDQQKLKENTKLIKLSFIITVTFAICVAPNAAFWLIYEFGEPSQMPWFTDMAAVSQICTFFNSAVNPIIYNMFSSNFRKAFRELLKTIGAPLCRLFKGDSFHRKMKILKFYRNKTVNESTELNAKIITFNGTSSTA